jgi:hypothetical protein
MESRRSPYVRKDGTRQTFYLCASRRHGTGTCDAPRVDAAKVDQAIMARLTAWTTDWKTWKDEQARALERERAALKAELASRQREAEQRVKVRDKMRKRYIDKPSDATEEALVECRRLVAEAEARVEETRKRLDAYPTEPDTDALLDVQARFNGIATDPKLTINAKAKLLLKEVRIFTHPNGDVTLQCVGREDVVIPPLQPDTKTGVGDVPAGYHVIPSPEAQRALLTIDSNAWAWQRGEPLGDTCFDGPLGDRLSIAAARTLPEQPGWPEAPHQWGFDPPSQRGSSTVSAVLMCRG